MALLRATWVGCRRDRLMIRGTGYRKTARLLRNAASWKPIHHRG
jgi:hypothetical protein